MDGPTVVTEDALDPPPRILERLRQLAGYVWDDGQRPFHSTYDNWHFLGTRFVSPYSTTSSTPTSQNVTSPPVLTTKYSSSSSVPQNEGGSERSITSPPPISNAAIDFSNVEELPVVARVSYHVLREERNFHLCKSMTTTYDAEGEHNVKPVDLIRLAPQAGDRGSILVAIYASPGPNSLSRIMDLGPAFYFAKWTDDKYEADLRDNFRLDEPISLQHFLQFSIHACECLELLHHQQGMVHGELRADAFHYNMGTGKVKLTSFGSGVRSFEHGLTSIGWSTLSKELGAKHKLAYISPEQTGRMPAEPDTRTDIYSLGVVFWQLLTQQPVFTGAAPLDIVQCVLNRRIPMVSNIRLDIPEVVGRIIQKCVSKNMQDRYHSVSGLRYDLEMVRKFLMEGDVLALKEWRIAFKDVSSFFMLPTAMFGRQSEKKELIKVIDRVASSHSLNSVNATNRFSDGSSLSNDYLDAPASVSSEGASSIEGENRGSGSFSQTISSDPRPPKSSFQPSLNGTDTLTLSSDTISSGHSNISVTRLAKPWDRHQSLSLENNSLNESFSLSQPSRYSSTDGASSSLSRQLGSAKFRRHGHCEVVTVEGASGLGKSFLVSQVLADARRRGYVATSKFDTARRTTFGPLLRLVSSLFRQVWGERNTETPLHMALRDYVRPVWPMLHPLLGLPEFLFGSLDSMTANTSGSAASSPSKGRSSASLRRRESSTGNSPSLSHSRGPHGSSQSSQDFLRGGGAAKTIRVMTTCIEILRIFTTYHFVCFCLDGLHCADDESLELLASLIAARLRMVLILTYRPDEVATEKIERMLNPAETPGETKAGRPRVTKIVLSPLGEADIKQYVASTLCRPPEEVVPLALVIQSKTAGNPFYVREMLNACYRSRCIWYDYRESRWLFDLDKLFEQFKGEYDFLLDNDFITQRLNELPPASRTILAWASLLGNSFSFSFVCNLLSEQCDSSDVACSDSQEDAILNPRYSKKELVEGLQAAVTACVLTQSDSDDRFKFAHDRYVQAASSLKECQKQKMHFMIAQTLLKNYHYESQARDNTASHICEAVDLIKEQEQHRQPYRKHLIDCATSRVENGARPSAAKYYKYALLLLQEDPWTDGMDASYDETLQLYLRAAECYVYMGKQHAAAELLRAIFSNAKSAEDQAPAWLLQSRILAQNGDSESALTTLKRSLVQLQVGFDEEPTYDKLDAEFMQLATKMKSQDRADVMNLAGVDHQLVIVGALLAEACSAAFWSDCLDFYSLVLAMMRLHVEKGPVPQSGMGFLYFAMIALSRFNMVDFAAELGSQCVELLDSIRDPYSSARGYMIYANFVSHIFVPISAAVNQLEQAVDITSTAGDHISVILSFGLSAQMRFFASEKLADLEAICQYCCEEVPGWQEDTRGGTFLISIRQVVRALQGKTRTTDSLEVMSDEQHSSSAYKAWLTQHTHNGGRSVVIYETMEIIPLYLYGHYEQACEVGRRCIENLHLIWSARNTRVIYLYYGLALAGLLLRKLHDCTNSQSLQTEVQETIAELERLNKHIKDWQLVSDVNYLPWSKWLDAQISELRNDHGAAIRQYEAALDHAAEQDLVFEEAVGNFLMAGYFIRQSARRSARAVLKESLGLWYQIGANGITQRIEEEHGFLLHGPAQQLKSADVGVQTDFTGDTSSVPYADVDEVQAAVPSVLEETTETRTAAWRGSMQSESGGAGLPALDMIDLHAILLSSQVISSVLQVDNLLKTMCDVILQSCGGSATSAAIVVQDDESNDGAWCVAASGEPEKGAVAHFPGLPLEYTSLVAENVVLYCVRFRESLFIPDLISDERFPNVSGPWLLRNPLSKAIIAIPICHGDKPLLGVLYLEGEPGAFTDRHMTLLKLLVSQIAISYSNALAIKAMEKVSHENVSMVGVQKEALAKAKKAEAEAKTAMRAKSMFLANVSHELRTPLNGVIGNSELLKDSDLSKEQMEWADSIRVSADLLLTVINDILDFSRMEFDQIKLHEIAFSPREMVQEVVRAVSYSNRDRTSKHVQIIKDINLPPMLIYGDPIRLHQVLGNLIGNSLKFTDEGSITIGARLDSNSTERAKLTFWVKDTGIGIAPAQLAKLFKPFSQADASTARRYGGSGLGLSICKNLIESMMKGKIELKSQENVGTTVWFSVTFNKAKPEVVAGDVQAAQGSRVPDKLALPPREMTLNPYIDLTQIPKEKIRIAVAEDNLINQKIAVQYLKKLGFSDVDTYDNGKKAVEGMREKAKAGKPYHVCLMDVQMPVLDGYEATKLLRKSDDSSVRKTLVIAMTASAIQGDREKCIAAGMNDYMAKPVKADVLKKKLDAYMTGGDDTSETSTPHVHSRPALQDASNNVSPATSSSSVTITTQRPSASVRGTASTDRNSSVVMREAIRDPLPDAAVIPSRSPSDNRSSASDTGSITEATTSTSTTTASTSKEDTKRLTKKLTKSRKNSMNSPESERIEHRPKNVLRKSARQSSTSLDNALPETMSQANVLLANDGVNGGEEETQVGTGTETKPGMPS